MASLGKTTYSYCAVASVSRCGDIPLSPLALTLTLRKAASDIKPEELKLFQEKGGQDAFKDTMVACMSTAATADAKKACSDTAKATYAASMGVDASSVSAAEMERIKAMGAASSMQTTMSACGAAAGTDATKQADCMSTTAKAALTAALGRTSSVTDVELGEYVKRGAVDAFTDTMAACTASAGTNSSQLKACRDSTAAGALATSLGRSSVTATEVQQFAADAAKQNVATQTKWVSA